MTKHAHSRAGRTDAFTLLEAVVAIVIIAIVVALSIPAIASIRARMQRARCTTNLRNLYVGAELYLQQYESWPQIRYNPTADEEAFARAWIDALTPFGVDAKTWICPTVQNLLRNPDYLDGENTRIDYTPMPFDDKPGTPHRWARQPWFVETGDVHGHGNLIVFTDGSISDLKTVTAGASQNP